MVVCSQVDENVGIRPRRITAVIECTRCRRKFLNEADLQLHMRDAHSGIKENFECKQCGKQFGNQHILQLHTRLHASQTSSPPSEGTSPAPEGTNSPPEETSPLEKSFSDAVTITSTSQSNGSLKINFSVSLNINLKDGLDSLDLDSKLNELLANATRASFHEALRREKIEKLANQPKLELSEPTQNVNSCNKTNDISDADGNQKKTADSSSPAPPALTDHDKNVNDGSLPEPLKEASKLSVANVSPPKPPPVRVNPHNRPKKVVGLTKIRMEDCQRCDACSCIYIDERDYIKHMKNFHKQDVIRQVPIKPKQKKIKALTQHQARRSKRQQHLLEQQPQDQSGKKASCRSCCKSCKCRGSSDTLEPYLPIVRPIIGRSGRRNSYSTQDSWNQFAQHLEGAQGVILRQDSESMDTLPQMKQDLDSVADFSDLLSRVEVKIKTEPNEVEELPVTVKIEPHDEMDSDSCSVY